MKLASKLVSVAAATAAASAFMVTTAGPASAADQKVFSSTGNAYGWYDDANNRFVVCDMKGGDDRGARGQITQFSYHWDWARTVYSGCETATGIPDGYSMYLTVCDWVWVDGQGRVPRNCGTMWFDS